MSSDKDKDKSKDKPGEDGGSQGPGDGLTEEFEAQFGEDFGADVADEMAIEQADEEDVDEEEDEEVEEDLDDDDDDELDDDAEADEGPDSLEVLSQETVEADVVELADEEEAREKAERDARAAQEALEAGSATGTHEHVAQATGEAPLTAEDELAEDDRPPKPGLWPRFLAGSMVVVIAMATATSVTILLYFTKIAKGLGGLPGVEKQLEAVDPGKPQTILIMGSDIRPAIEDKGRSDTTMLLRLDPDNEAIALLSLPRDLRVNIPGYGVGKLNEAYTDGGPKLTTQVVKQLTGLQINHVVNVDFAGFEKAINAIDCVYVDVDRQYYHSNEGLATSDYYSEINIKAGYQLLCGERALQYVRYRHTDNDLVRSARQQDFLREARQKIGPARLFRDRDKLLDIFTKYTTSDINSAFELKDVLELFLASAHKPVKQVHFQGELGSSYVTASTTQIKTAVQQFLGIKDTPGSLGGADKGKRDGKSKKKKKDRKQEKKKADHKPVAPALIDVDASGLAAAYAPKVKFPVFYPTKLVPGSTVVEDESREYKIADEDDNIHTAYKMVFSIPGTSVPLEYYGLMGTTWTDPPILDNPSETREIGGRTYDLFYDGDRLRTIAWHTDDAAYWLSNTLVQTLDEDEMIAIADSMAEVEPPKKKKKK